MELKMKKLFIYSLLVLLFVSCDTKTSRHTQEETNKSLNGKILKDNNGNYYMVKYEYNNILNYTIFNITKVDKNDVKVFFK